MSDNLALQERLAFIALDQEAQTALAKAKPIIEQALPASLDAFYDQVRRFPDVAKLFGSESHISGAKGARRDTGRSSQRVPLTADMSRSSESARPMRGSGWSRAGTLAATRW